MKYILIKNKFIVEFGFLGKERNIIAKAMWPFIFYKEDPLSRTVLEHEKIHLKQQLKGFLIFFYIKYIYYHIKYGYKNNPYELEAYKHQEDYKRIGK